jgi:GNAT superfamily N-acetyltransferase
MPDTFLLRPANPADARVLAEHRVGMFRDIGTIHPDVEAALREASIEYFASALSAGEYFGWIAYRPEDSTAALGGAGVQLRSLLPRPEPNGRGLLLGREGLILNVYVEPQWRRRGLARRLMTEILGWAGAAGVVRLVLHASADGRPLYETLGFTPSNEMRYTGTLAASAP